MAKPANKFSSIAAGPDGPAPARSVRSVDDLAAAGLAGMAAIADLERVAARFSVAITPAMLDLTDPASADGPIARQFVPDVRELEETDSDEADPIGDQSHSPLPGIIHRYPDRLLLTPIKVCPLY